MIGIVMSLEPLEPDPEPAPEPEPAGGVATAVAPATADVSVAVGVEVGVSVGVSTAVGVAVGAVVGAAVGAAGRTVGARVGTGVGAGTGVGVAAASPMFVLKAQSVGPPSDADGSVTHDPRGSQSAAAGIEIRPGPKELAVVAGEDDQGVDVAGISTAGVAKSNLIQAPEVKATPTTFDARTVPSGIAGFPVVPWTVTLTTRC